VANADELLDLTSAETHKPHWEALTTDLLPLLAACRWHERNASRILRTRALGGRPFWLPGQRCSISREPLGRVAIIATWNYPVQLLGIQMLQALLAGNTLVVKPSEHAPRTQQRLIEIFIQAGLLPGTLRGYPATREAGPQMLRDEHPDHVIFTGSTAVGRQVAAWAAERLIPTTLELSGSDTALVLADADPALAARSIWNAVTMNSGQTCMAPRGALVHRSMYAAFLRQLAPLAAGARPRQVITDRAANDAFALVQHALASSNARSLSGIAEAPRDGSLRPLAIVDCPLDCPLLDGDHFAPVLAVAPFDSLDDALAIHARIPQHLATAVFTRSRFSLPPLHSSIVTLNDCVIPTGHPALAIIGRGQSGWGATRGAPGLLAMTHPVQVCRSSFFRPPLVAPTAAAASRLQRFLLRFYS